MTGKLRIFFTSEDLARTRVSAAADPLWELVTSLHKLGTKRGGLVFDHWRQMVDGVPRTLREKVNGKLIRSLVPRRGDFPDFLTPIAGQDGLAAGLDAITHTPAARLAADLDFVARSRSLPVWARDLATASPTALTELNGALRAYHDTYLAPYWPTIQAHVDADRALRARAFLAGGVEGMLASLRPVAHWERPVLAAPYPVDWDVHLEGRGLVLIPSYFCWYNPVTLIDQTCPTPVLVYPVDHDLTLTATTGGERRLSALIGRTRAEVLTVLADMHTTGEIARRFGLSPPTVSLHTTTLREAGLITTRRDGNVALHVRTPLGTALCHACGRP